MHDPLTSPASNVLTRAQREIQIMTSLKNGPLTVREIAANVGMNPRTVKCIIQDLNRAKVTYREARHIFLENLATG